MRFDKSSPQNSDLLGVSEEGGRFMYGRVKQFEAFYGSNSHDEDQNLTEPANLKLDRNDFTDFSFRSSNKAVLLSMSGRLSLLDLKTKRVVNSAEKLNPSVFCSDSESQG